MIRSPPGCEVTTSNQASTTSIVAVAFVAREK